MKKIIILMFTLLNVMGAYCQFNDAQTTHIYIRNEASTLNDGSTTRLAYVFRFEGKKGHVLYTSEKKITKLVKTNPSYCETWDSNMSYNLEFYETYKGCYIYKCEKLLTSSGKWLFDTEYYLFSSDKSKMLEMGKNLTNLKKGVGRKYIEISCEELSTDYETEEFVF